MSSPICRQGTSLAWRTSSTDAQGSAYLPVLRSILLDGLWPVRWLEANDWNGQISFPWAITDVTSSSIMIVDYGVGNLRSLQKVSIFLIAKPKKPLASKQGPEKT